MRDSKAISTSKAGSEWKNKNGYILYSDSEHPLSMSNGTIYKHRALAYDKYGANLPACEICSKELTWKTCHIDHINEDRSDNNLDNLRPLCPKCNRARGQQKSIKTIREKHRKITCFGETKSIKEWARDPRIKVSDFCISSRLKKGWSHESALLKPSEKGRATKGGIVAIPISGVVGYFLATPDQCKILGFSPKNISACVTGRRPQHKGYKFIRMNS